MTLYEVHSALARNLGDPFKSDGLSTIYDGVRYSAEARKNYLYRACCSIISEVITQVAMLPQEQGAMIFARVFPSLIARLNVDSLSSDTVQEFNFYDNAYNPDSIGIAYILGTYVYENDTVGTVPVPLLDPLRARKITSVGSRGQMNDPIAWVVQAYNYSPTNAFRVSINKGSMNLDSYSFGISFIRYPLNQVLSDGTLGFDFESSYYNTVLNKATLYGMTDGGDLTPEQILPLLAK
jgi:hypothetical protein